MDTASFPRTRIGSVSVSRMIIGTNWLLGWSHTSQAADQHICAVNRDRGAIASVLEAFLSRGVDTVMGPLSEHP